MYSKTRVTNINRLRIQQAGNMVLQAARSLFLTVKIWPYCISSWISIISLFIKFKLGQSQIFINNFLN